MPSFFRLISKYSAYFYFAFYCGLSVLLMQLQRKETLNALMEQGLAVNAAVSSKFTEVTEIFTVKRENEKLVLQNARLFAKLLQQQAALRDAAALNALSYRTAGHDGGFVIARVVDRRFSATDNMLIIDAGRRSGVSEDMAVMTPDGLVGRVIMVTDHYAKVLPLINENFRASVVSDITGTIGILGWKGGDDRMALMEHVPLSSSLRVGEQVITSGYSTFAVQGVPVGRVAGIRKEKLFLDVDIRLAVDFSSLSHLLVSTNIPSREKVTLMGSPDGETEQPDRSSSQPQKVSN